MLTRCNKGRVLSRSLQSARALRAQLAFNTFIPRSNIYEAEVPSTCRGVTSSFSSSMEKPEEKPPQKPLEKPIQDSPRNEAEKSEEKSLEKQKFELVVESKHNMERYGLGYGSC